MVGRVFMSEVPLYRFLGKSIATHPRSPRLADEHGPGAYIITALGRTYMAPGRTRIALGRALDNGDRVPRELLVYARVPRS